MSFNNQNSNPNQMPPFNQSYQGRDPYMRPSRALFYFQFLVFLVFCVVIILYAYRAETGAPILGENRNLKTNYGESPSRSLNILLAGLRADEELRIKRVEREDREHRKQLIGDWRESEHDFTTSYYDNDTFKWKGKLQKTLHGVEMGYPYVLSVEISFDIRGNWGLKGDKLVHILSPDAGNQIAILNSSLESSSYRDAFGFESLPVLKRRILGPAMVEELKRDILAAKQELIVEFPDQQTIITRYAPMGETATHFKL